MLPPVERGSRLGKAHGLLRKCCFFDLSVIPVVPTSSLVCEFFFFLSCALFCMYESGHNKNRKARFSITQYRVLRYLVWGGFYLFWGKRMKTYLNIHMGKFWKGKQSFVFTSGIEGLGRESEMSLYVVSIHCHGLIS